MFKKYFIVIIAVVIVIYGFISINIYNTIALSPIGNTDDNFKMVSSEFGEDFSEFIKDKSPMKIYLGELDDKEAKVNIGGKVINLTQDNIFLKGVKPTINYIKNTFTTIMDKFNNKTKNNNENSVETNSIQNSNNNGNDNVENSEDVQNQNSDLDNIVDEFINSGAN